MIKISLENINVEYMDRYSIWRFVNDDSSDEELLTPVLKTPVKDLNGKVVFTKVKLSNESFVYSMIGNIDLNSPALTKHLLNISVYNDGKWFHLARYFDVDRETKNASALAQFLGLNISEVFPIYYDISSYVKSSSEALKGTVLIEPEVRLSKDELMDMVISEL